MGEPSVAPLQPDRGATMQPSVSEEQRGATDWIFFIHPVEVNDQH